MFAGPVIVIICCVLVELISGNENVSKYVDPVVSVVACIVLLTLSYPYSKYTNYRKYLTNFNIILFL